jgi:hypothetical protein
VHIAASIKPVVRADAHKRGHVSSGVAKDGGHSSMPSVNSTASFFQPVEALPWRPMNIVPKDSRDIRMPIFGVSAFWIEE